MASGSKCFITGAILGGLIGGATALLFAPKAGEKLRKDLKKKYHRFSKQTKDTVEYLNDEAQELVDRAKEIARKAKEAAQTLID